MVFAKIGDPLHLNIFPHMDVITFDIFFNSVIKLRILRNTTTMTQYRNIRGFEELCLPNSVVHIPYGCFVCYLINNSYQISSKLRHIIIKESVHTIKSGFLIEVALNITFNITCHGFFLCLIFLVRS